MGPKGARKRKEQEPEDAPVQEQPVDEPSEDEGEEDDEPETDYTKFMQQIKDKEQQLDKFCVMLGQIEPDSEEEDEDEDEEEAEKEPSMEQLQALARVYVPNEFEAHFEEVAGQLEEIGCSDDELSDEEGEKLKLPEGFPKFALRMLNTRHSLPMQMILQDKMKKVDKALKSQKFPEAFCWWAATTLAAKREPHWWADTESPEVAESIYKKLRTQWLKLREHSEEELGGLVLEGSAKSLKEELDNVLQGLADDMKQMDYNLPSVVAANRKAKKK